MLSNKKIIFIAMLMLLVFVAVGCNSSSESQSESNTIRIGTSGGYHPFTFMNENNKLDGFEIDVWNEIGKRINRGGIRRSRCIRHYAYQWR